MTRGVCDPKRGHLRCNKNWKGNPAATHGRGRGPGYKHKQLAGRQTGGAERPEVYSLRVTQLVPLMLAGARLVVTGCSQESPHLPRVGGGRECGGYKLVLKGPDRAALDVGQLDGWTLSRRGLVDQVQSHTRYTVSLAADGRLLDLSRGLGFLAHRSPIQLIVLALRYDHAGGLPGPVDTSDK